MTDLVRVRIGGVEKNVGASFAKIHDLTVLDEPTTKGDGSPRPATRKNGRRPKPRTTVAESATAKKGAVASAPTNEEK